MAKHPAVIIGDKSIKKETGKHRGKYLFNRCFFVRPEEKKKIILASRYYDNVSHFMLEAALEKADLILTQTDELKDINKIKFIRHK